MVLLKIGIFFGLTYLLAKAFSLHYEQENEKLRAKITVIEESRAKEKQKYEKKIGLMNDAFDQMRK